MLGSLIRVTSLATSEVNRMASLQAQLGGLFLVSFATLEDLHKCEQAFQGHLRYYKTLLKWS